MSAIFELFRDDAGCYRFHLKSASGEVIALSDTYPTRAGAEVAIESIRHSAAHRVRRRQVTAFDARAIDRRWLT